MRSLLARVYSSLVVLTTNDAPLFGLACPTCGNVRSDETSADDPTTSTQTPPSVMAYAVAEPPEDAPGQRRAINHERGLSQIRALHSVPFEWERNHEGATPGKPPSGTLRSPDGQRATPRHRALITGCLRRWEGPPDRGTAKQHRPQGDVDGRLSGRAKGTAVFSSQSSVLRAIH